MARSARVARVILQALRGESATAPRAPSMTQPSTCAWSEAAPPPMHREALAAQLGDHVVLQAVGGVPVEGEGSEVVDVHEVRAGAQARAGPRSWTALAALR
eukprot:9120401-Pyramimonas_sp.AAC.1